jgi:hypothetical protein
MVFHHEYNLTKPLHWDINFPLATTFAPIPVDIRTMQKALAATAPRPAAMLELKVQRARGFLG